MLWEDVLLNIGMLAIVTMGMYLVVSIGFWSPTVRLTVFVLGVGVMAGALALKPIDHHARQERCDTAGGKMFQGECLDRALFKRIAR